MKSILVALSLCAALLVACVVPSLHTLYDDPMDGIEVKGLAGLWQGVDDDDGAEVFYVEFEYVELRHEYIVRLWGSEEDTAKLRAVAVPIGQRLYLDTVPDSDAELDEESTEDMLLAAHMILGHLFYEVRVDGDDMKVGFVHNNELAKEIEGQIKAGQPTTIPAARATTMKGFVFTGTPRELRAWILENQDREGYLVEDYGALRRVSERVWPKVETEDED